MTEGGDEPDPPAPAASEPGPTPAPGPAPRPRRPRPTRPRPAPVDSKPAGGSASGASRRSRSATRASSSTCSRQLGQAARCDRPVARSGPVSSPRASSAPHDSHSPHAGGRAPLMATPLSADAQRVADAEEAGADPGLGRPQGDALALAHLLGRPPAEGGQHDRPPLLLRQPGQRRSQPDHLRRDLGRGRGGVGYPRRANFERGQGGGVDGGGAMAAEGVDGQVAGDGQQPRVHRPSAGVVGAGVAPGPHERLLGHVLGQGRVADDGAGQAEDPGLVPADEGGGGLGVAHAEAGQQRVVGSAPHLGAMLRPPSRRGLARRDRPNPSDRHRP